jgi:hypothetical protein
MDDMEPQGRQDQSGQKRGQVGAGEIGARTRGAPPETAREQKGEPHRGGAEDGVEQPVPQVKRRVGNEPGILVGSGLHLVEGAEGLGVVLRPCHQTEVLDDVHPDVEVDEQRGIVEEVGVPVAGAENLEGAEREGGLVEVVQVGEPEARFHPAREKSEEENCAKKPTDAGSNGSVSGRPSHGPGEGKEDGASSLDGRRPRATLVPTSGCRSCLRGAPCATRSPPI